MRKFAQTLMKSASISVVTSLKFKTTNLNARKALLSATIAGYGFWFASKKVFNAEN